MELIERFFYRVFGTMFSRIRYGFTSSVERKVRTSVEQQYDRAVSSKGKKSRESQG